MSNAGLRLGQRTSAASSLQGRWAILPVGSCEAHGPHLPLDTDVRIAEETAILAAEALDAVVLPPLPYGVTEYAAAFDGTVGVPAAVVIASIDAVIRSAVRQGAVGIAITNAHFEPAHIDAIFQAVAALTAVGPGSVGVPVVFPNVASRRYASLLGDEFPTGACHAGDYESSMILALRPDLVDEDAMRALPDVPINLAAAMRAGAHDFAEAGGVDAYFGWPSRADATRGRQLLKTLAHIVVDAVIAARGPAPAP